MKQYTSCPLKGKKVLVIDDVCSKGMSFEAARHYLAKAGSSAISVSFMKAMSHDYASLAVAALPNGPFKVNTNVKHTKGRVYYWRNYIADPASPSEISDRLQKYQKWGWPAGI
jgi:hypoxanthine phosphoribosyltransferase